MTDQRKTNYSQLVKFINEMNILQDSIGYYFQESDFDEFTTFDDLTRAVEDSNGFDVEIIYYSRAMEYLSENDSSLTESLTLAADMGYSPTDINSELLATLLASENTRKDWYEAENEVQDFLDGLDWDEPDEDEEDEPEDEPDSPED